MRPRQLFKIAIATLLAAAAAPADHAVHQKGRVFSMQNITVAPGEPVLFVNDDTVPHNVMSVTPGNEFDLGSQAPGSAIPVSFDRTGIVSVICAIHPRMRMTITVVR
jgi:plastocyanin